MAKKKLDLIRRKVVSRPVVKDRDLMRLNDLFLQKYWAEKRAKRVK